jgi:HAMP domain-containing protein
MRLELRFTLILIFCFSLGVAVAGGISYALEFRHARDSVAEKARVLLATALSMRSYTADQVAPLVAPLNDETHFHPEMVPSYGAQTTLGKLASEFPDYKYREASLNPTNIADRAADWEVALFRAFKADPELKEISGETGDDDGKRFFLARALRLSNPACLQCHSTPDAAPRAMLARYGANNGFNWKLGDVVGLQIVEVPVTPTRNKALNGVIVTVGSLTCVLLIISCIFLLLLRRYVVRPLQHVTRSASSISLGEAPPARGGVAMEGQFHELESAIGRLKASLDEALRSMRGDGKAPRE